MRIGVVSDTHNNLKNVARIVELFNTARVERVIHTGDITQAKTVRMFAGSDSAAMGRVRQQRPGTRDTRSGDRRMRIPLRGPAARSCTGTSDASSSCTTRGISNTHSTPDHHVALHGHTHHHRLERSGARLIFNPGECAGHMEGYNAVGIVDLESLDAEILRF